MKFSYYDLFSKLKFVTRFSGDNLIQPEKLESHIIEMIGLAFDLHYGVGGFDLKQAIYLIVIHDIDEAITVDVPRPFKYFSDEFRVLLNKTVHDYFESLGVDKQFLSDAESAKKCGIEGKIVKLLDLVQVKKKLETEAALGNTTLDYKLKRVNSYLDLMRKDESIYKYLNYLI